jgi:hypothetical protein
VRQRENSGIGYALLFLLFRIFYKIQIHVIKIKNTLRS